MEQTPAPSEPNASAAPSPAGPKPLSMMAVISVVSSVLGFCLLFPSCFGFVLGLIALAATVGKAPKRRGSGLAITGIVVSIIALLAWGGFALLMYPALQAAREAALSTQQAVRVKQTTLALHSYAADNHGVLPPADGWRDALAPYLDDPTLLTGAPSKGLKPIVLNRALAGRHIDQFELNNTVLVFCGQEGDPESGGKELLIGRHGSAKLHVFGIADGSCQIVREGHDLDTLQWNPPGITDDGDSHSNHSDSSHLTPPPMYSR